VLEGATEQLVIEGARCLAQLWGIVLEGRDERVRLPFDLGSRWQSHELDAPLPYDEAVGLRFGQHVFEDHLVGSQSLLDMR
jgi:hypothetical protein